jgi:hypothetical protein
LSKKKQTPEQNWSSVKRGLGGFKRKELLDLIRDLYRANQDNRTFLHTRLGQGADPLKPYKAAIQRWMHPDIFSDQDYAVSKAKKAISDYKKAEGNTENLAELSLYFCEQGMDFLSDCGLDDEGFYDSLARMFANALKLISQLGPERQNAFMERISRVFSEGQEYGYGLGYDMADSIEHYGFAALLEE